jgi:hypothetical protein
MTELRVAETDEDLELWRSALLPNERTAPVAELRAGGSFLLLAITTASWQARAPHRGVTSVAAR